MFNNKFKRKNNLNKFILYIKSLNLYYEIII